MSWDVILDPAAVATNRTELDLNSSVIRVDQAGIDWGQAVINAYLAQQGRWGSAPVDYDVPNRIVTIPLFLGADESGLEEQARAQLQQKVGLLQREGGWLRRQRDGGLPMYADIVNASLTLPDKYGEGGGIEENVSLALECLPDLYGDEITLDQVAATGVLNTVLKSTGAQADVQGDYPARARIVVTDTSGNDQLGMVWGVRSRHYDPASTAALFYEAEALTGLNATASASQAGASGGHVMAQSSLVAGAWMPVLSTALASGGAQLTHHGSYRVWCRCYSASASPSLRLAWGVGSPAAPNVNDPVALPGAGAFYLLDLGVVRLDPSPTGSYSWQGVIQAMSRNNGDPVSIDCLFLQPLDESAGALSAIPQATTPASVAVTDFAGSYANDASSGTVAWSIGNPNHVTVTVGQLSEYLKATGYGFAIPAGATIRGIELQISRQAAGDIVDQTVKLVKAGAVVGSNRAIFAPPWPAGGIESIGAYGGPSDLWGTTWTPADVNDASFGAVLQVTCSNALGLSDPHANVLPMSITVYFTIGSGLTLIQDTVVYAGGQLELRHDGMFRPDPAAAAWSPVTTVKGDLVRIPPSGMEDRPVELFLKPSQGDLDQAPDGGLDSLTAQVIYRPCWLSRP